MDILLRNKYSYNLRNSLEQTKEKLLAVCGGRFDTFSSRLPEVIDEDGNFNLRSNFSLISPVSSGQAIYLRGQMVPTEGGTAVNIVLSPNVAFIFAFYLLPIVSLNVLFGDNSLMGAGGTRFNNITIIVIAEIVVVLIVQISSYFMKRKFENALEI
jgi:hypothetical protein